MKSYNLNAPCFLNKPNGLWWALKKYRSKLRFRGSAHWLGSMMTCCCCCCGCCCWWWPIWGRSIPLVVAGLSGGGKWGRGGPWPTGSPGGLSPGAWAKGNTNVYGPSCRFNIDGEVRFQLVGAACNQSYESFTALYLQVWKYRAIFYFTCSHMYCPIQFAHDFFHFLIQNILDFECELNKFDNTCGFKWFLNSPVFTDL